MMNLVSKKWGREEWIVNNELYCGKFLYFNKGEKCSLHFHRIKHETFFIMRGTFEIHLEPIGQKPQIAIYGPGSTITVPVDVMHRMLGLDDENIILEISTHHEDSDSYRIPDAE